MWLCFPLLRFELQISLIIIKLTHCTISPLFIFICCNSSYIPSKYESHTSHIRLTYIPHTSHIRS